MSRKKTLNEFKNELYAINPSIEIVGEFNGVSKPVAVRCLRCGRVWNANPQHLLSGTDCRICAIKNRDAKYRGKNKRKTTEQFIEELSKVSPDVIVTGLYVSARKHIECLCRVCSYRWNARPTNLLNGCGCPECGYRNTSKKQLLSFDDVMDRVKSALDNVIIIGDYKGEHTQIRCRCTRCMHEWNALPSNLFRGEGCPACRASRGERAIEAWLTEHGIPFIAQKTFSGLRGIGGGALSYDFYIPNRNCLIEYQGEFHDHTARIQTADDFRKQQAHDSMKRNYAESNNFNLVKIWYYDNISERLTKVFNITEPVTTTAS